MKTALYWPHEEVPHDANTQRTEDGYMAAQCSACGAAGEQRVARARWGGRLGRRMSGWGAARGRAAAGRRGAARGRRLHGAHGVAVGQGESVHAQRVCQQRALQAHVVGDGDHGEAAAQRAGGGA